MIKIFTEKVQFTFILVFALHFNSYAQERRIIPLNEHFFAIEAGGGEHVFNNVVSFSEEGEMIEKIYNLENKLISIKKSILEDSQEKTPLWEQEQHFTLDGDLEYTRIKYKNEDGNFTKIIRDGNLILDLKCKSFDCKGFYITDDQQMLECDRDVFESGFPTVKTWSKLLNKHLRFPEVAKQPGSMFKIWIGFKIDESGEMIENAVMNKNLLHPSISKEVERIITKYNGKFMPAIDFDGNPITSWFYITLIFRGGG